MKTYTNIILFSSKALPYVTLLIFLVFFIYAVIGMQVGTAGYFQAAYK
jgi:ABC-type methionine transport system permease subunit